eukprot:TRINITY_DN9396_c0_g1_i2.p1 TRINITY_DN9396_c0_g1~~TRINITY_DN9396_c0_g1_i2.p1  ORF type:complete len:370 (-),score=39.04 TRINITY_DN9396_c0_g1_i2:107-1216(-)
MQERSQRYDMESLTLQIEDPPAQNAGSRVQWHHKDFLVRLVEELQVLRQVWCSLVFYFVFMAYGAAIPLRNLAFLRYKGLEVYAEKVAPQWASASVLSAGVQLVNASGHAVPLKAAVDSQYLSSSWNVSVPIQGPRTNLSALGGEAFNLQDFGEEYLWDFTDNDFVSHLNEVVAGMQPWMMVLLCIVPFVVSFPGKPRVSPVVMAHRLLRALCVAHALRAPTYLATTIPGAAPHCQSVRWPGYQPRGGWEENQKYIRGAWDILFNTHNLTNNSNCGDLIFSGHIVTCTTFLLAVLYYSWQLFPPRFAYFVISFQLLLFFAQIFCVLTAHDHYTVDVTISLYVAPLSFLAQLYIWPTDLKPSQRDTDQTT